MSSLIVVGLLLGAVAAACGDGVELTLEQYFAQLTTIVEDLQEQTETLDQPLDQETDSEADQIEAFRDAFTMVLPVFLVFIDDLDELNPPAEIAEAHADLVAGFADLVEGLEEFIDQIADVESASEFSELLLDPDSKFGLAIGQLAAVCLQLQSVADENSIDADLRECAG